MASADLEIDISSNSNGKRTLITQPRLREDIRWANKTPTALEKNKKKIRKLW